MDLRAEFQNNSGQIILFGLFQSAAEMYRKAPPGFHSSRGKPSAHLKSRAKTLNFFAVPQIHNTTFISPTSAVSMDCFFVAVETLIGITQAKSIWASIVGGSYNVGTVIQALKLIGSRVAGVITVGIMIYSVGCCLDWWYIVPYEEETRNDTTWKIDNEIGDSSEIFPDTLGWSRNP